MSICAHTIVEQSPRTAARVIDGQAVVIVIDRQRLHTLNEVGTFVWTRAERRSVSAIVDEIVETYPIDRDSALRDVVTFVQHLADAGAVRVSDPP